MSAKKTPQKQSFLIAAVVVVIFAAGVMITHLSGKMYDTLWLILLGVIIFAATYLAVHRVLLDFMEKNINPIYKTIHNVTHSQKNLRKKIDSKDISTELHGEVEEWADNQNAEIRQFQEMEQYRKDFLGNVSHELKTPIFNMQGYILTLLDGGIDDPKINKLYLERAEKSINRMISIVDDLGSIARLESGEFKLSMDDFNLVRLVEDVFESLEMMARKYKVKLELDKNYTKAIKVRGDRKRIMEVLNNLLVNSIKYGRPGGKTRVGFEESGKKVLIEVADNGIGIAQEDLPRIFERFYRVDKSRSRDSGGTGLGLAIVKHIILAHNQTINVRSSIDKGTTFTFTLDKA